MRVGVITFPGSNDDSSALRALKLADLEPVKIWHADTEITNVDALVLPGGRSYGDYLRPGALATSANIIPAVIEKAESGMPVLGIGNGFQVLTEAGLLPGALIRNPNQKFVREDAFVTIEKNDTPWTREFAAGEEIVLPFRSDYGAYYAGEETLAKLEEYGQIVLRYVGPNPAGFESNIAGVTNAAGNVVGVTPHPEFAVEPGFGPDTPERMRSGVSGLGFFRSLLLES